jgi:hypothetical protein
LRLDVGPGLALSSITEKVHDNGTLGDGLVNLKKVGSWDPAVLDSLLPRSTVLSDANDDIETVVTEVEALTVALRSVPNKGQSIIFEVILQSNCQT